MSYIRHDGPVIVALGSTSDLKIKAAQEAFKHFGQQIALVSVAVTSGVSDQPEGFDQMTAGAYARARAALDATPNAVFGIGLESGIVEIDAHYLDPAIACVVDRDGNHQIGFGPGFPIPYWAVDEARTSELGAVVMKRGAKNKNPMAYFSEGTIDRSELLAWAVRCALVPFLFAKLYERH